MLLVNNKEVAYGIKTLSCKKNPIRQGCQGAESLSREQEDLFYIHHFKPLRYMDENRGRK